MKKQNGITLISLIITIIIMLILAGVSLSMVMGDGSMLDQANAAATKTKVTEVQEYIDLAAASNKMAKYSKIGLKSKETLAAEMVSQGLITEEEKQKVLNNEELTIQGTVIDFSQLESTYTDATNAGVTEDVNLITFKIENITSPHTEIEYQAEEGMKWGDWINSAYNTDGFGVHEDTVKYNHEDESVFWAVYYENLNGVAKVTDEIIEGYVYVGPWD